MDAFDMRQPGSIKSIQRGVAFGVNTSVTISRVDPRKTVLSLLGIKGYLTAIPSLAMGYIQLSSPTTLSITSANGANDTISWQIVEYN